MADSVEELSEEIAHIHELPPELVVAVGAVLMEFAHLEITLNILIWTILRLSITDGKNLTARLDTRPKLEILTAVSRRYIRRRQAVQTIKDHNKRIQDLTMYRNACAHGMWHMREDDLLYCSSFRWEAEEGFVGIKPISVRALIDVAEEIAQIDQDLMGIEYELPHSRRALIQRRRVMRPIPVRRPDKKSVPKRKLPRRSFRK